MLPRAPESIIITIGFFGSWLSISVFQFLLRLTPFSCNRIVTVIICNHPIRNCLVICSHTFVRFFNNFSLVFNNWNIGNPHCQTSKVDGGNLSLSNGQESRCFCCTEAFEDFRDNISKVFLLEWNI